MTTFLTFLKNQLGLEDVQTPVQTSAQFRLTYKSLCIGELQLENGNWTFSYSDAFKAQDAIDLLIGFPDKNKNYTSKELYPFFLNRIPSLKQPDVRELLFNEHIDSHNEVELLKRFGQKTITNPFLLAYS